jgi:NADP-dependent 3-hydroxy acid dehydrogenase YdfG
MKKEGNMHIEELALKMRQRALEVEAFEVKEAESIRAAKRARLEELKKLYFNAGRWAGGARDRTAREAFQKVSLIA